MADYQRINAATAYQAWQAGQARFFDIRDQRSFAMGHITGATELNNENVQDVINSIESGEHVVVVCYHGNSSQSAAQFLAEQGIEQVSSLDGGFTAWAQQYPDAVERG